MAGQPQTSPTVAEKPAKAYPNSALAERHRKRKLSANERAVEDFFTRNLPPGWTFQFEDRLLSLERLAPVFILSRTDAEASLLSKAALLALARSSGQRVRCRIEFTAERHDDAALVRQKIRLYQEIRRDVDQAYTRLNLRHLCQSQTVQECSLEMNKKGEAAKEYLVTRQILADKLEITPLYRIGTLYLYPKKNQCVPRNEDWYLTNTQVPENSQFLPLEAHEEAQVVLRNLEQLKLWN